MAPDNYENIISLQLSYPPIGYPLFDKHFIKTIFIPKDSSTTFKDRTNSVTYSYIHLNNRNLLYTTAMMMINTHTT